MNLVRSTGDPETPKYGLWPEYAEHNPAEEKCICPFVDVGVGIMQHGVDPDCLVCNEPLHVECTCADYSAMAHYRWFPGEVQVSLSPTPSRLGGEIDPACEIHGE